jgi:hypothetical protein
LFLRVTRSFHMLAVVLGPADILLMTEWHRAFSLSIPIPIPIATPTPIDPDPDCIPPMSG